jgi:hypothetical protein
VSISETGVPMSAGGWVMNRLLSASARLDTPGGLVETTGHPALVPSPDSRKICPPPRVRGGGHA